MLYVRPVVSLFCPDFPSRKIARPPDVYANVASKQCVPADLKYAC